MTRPYAEVIGDPIAHSKSPLIHNFWLAKLGIDAEYRKHQVSADTLSNYIADRRDDASWRGCNVTIPHKIAVIAHVADPGGIAGSIGAANSVLRTESGLIATNTDAAGFWAPIARCTLDDRQVVVIGSGGAARAVLFALSRVGVGSVTLMARNVLKGAALLAKFGLAGEVVALNTPLPPAALLVNASSLGMAGHAALSIDLDGLADDAVVYDLVYAPLETRLLASARARGLTRVDGLRMLVAQAATAFELFFGQPAPDHDDELRALLVK